MKAIRVTAIWCPACLIMRPIFDEICEEFNIETRELDYDIDEEEVLKIKVGNVLPVFILYNSENELIRIIGENKKEKIIELIKEVQNENN